jgi:RNA polymerase sigma-70 factor (ECF subfamily)
MIDRFNKLAHRLKDGDRQAGEEIFDYFSRQIYRFFVVKTSNRETAEDLTQEVFLKAIDKIETFNENLGSFSGWLWQIAKNTVKDYYRKKKTVFLSDFVLKNKENSDFLAGKNDGQSEQRMAEILDLVKDLNEEEQEVFSLHYLSDLSYREISNTLGKSESSLRVLVHRVNKKIRKIFNR